MFCQNSSLCDAVSRKNFQSHFSIGVTTQVHYLAYIPSDLGIMAPTVEVGMMHIQPGKTPMDSTTADGKILKQAWEAITAAPGGPQRVYWGTELADPSRIWAFFDWESLAQHAAFATS